MLGQTRERGQFGLHQTAPRRPADTPRPPAVDACARCAVPNASFTYRSPLRASSRANAGSFASSSGWKAHVLEHHEAAVGERLRTRRRRRRRRSRRRTRPAYRAARRDARRSGGARVSGRACRPGARGATGSRCGAPRSRSQRSVGSAAVMRVSSAIRPSFIGALRSSRRSTRLPRHVGVLEPLELHRSAAFDVGHANPRRANGFVRCGAWRPVCEQEHGRLRTVCRQREQRARHRTEAVDAGDYHCVMRVVLVGLSQQIGPARQSPAAGAGGAAARNASKCAANRGDDGTSQPSGVTM